MKHDMGPIQQSRLLEYCNGFDAKRFKRWVDVSYQVSSGDVQVMVTIQGLGKLDSKLTKEDEYIVKNGHSSNPLKDLSDHLTLSYLWVLGAYELIRTINQRDRELHGNDHDITTKSRGIKSIFERVRVPLAKFEAARRYEDTDGKIAYPVLNTEVGVGWKLGENIFITRQYLSNSFLEYSEERIH